jgi:hypothetical protein
MLRCLAMLQHNVGTAIREMERRLAEEIRETLERFPMGE